MGMLCCACVIKERVKQNTFSKTGYVKEYINYIQHNIYLLYLPSFYRFALGQEMSLPEVLSYVWVSCGWAIEQFEDNRS